MLRGRLGLFVLLTCVHLTLALGSMTYAFSSGMARFDEPAASPTVDEIAAGALAKVLMAPGSYLWTSWASQNLPNVLENMLMVANSALWGAAGVTVITRMRRAISVRE